VSAQYRGVLDTVPGRVTVRVRIPSGLLARAERIATEREVDVAIVLGDLVAQELPDALAEAARERLAPHLPPEKEEVPPAVTEGTSSEGFQNHAEHSLPLPGAESKPKCQVEGCAIDA
jgi:hypothetical protein